MKFKSILVVFTASAVLLAACGDSSSGASDADPALVSALAEAMGDAGLDGEVTFGAEASTCAAENIIDDIGADRLNEVGVSASGVPQLEDVDFTDAELDSVVGALGDCVDLPRMLADALAQDGTLSSEEADCFAKEFAEADLLPMFKIGISDPDSEPPASFMQNFLDVAAECDFNLGL